MTETADRVLVIEDDREIAGIVAMNLKDLGLLTEHASDGQTGLKKALSDDYSLIVLDLMLPGIDGLSVCTAIRKDRPAVPILMLTAKAEEIDRILGLELGADDYMTKPFSIRELNARVKALLRRSRLGGVQNPESGPAEQEPDESGSVRIGNLEMDFTKHRARLKGEFLELTAKEFDLLGRFIRNPGRAYSRAELLKSVWGYDFEGYEHTVNTHINRLRNKIESDPSNPKYLKTVWGIGYRFVEASEWTE